MAEPTTDDRRGKNVQSPLDLPVDRFGEDLGASCSVDFAPTLVRDRLLSQDENLAGLARINRDLIAKAFRPRWCGSRMGTA